MVAQHVLVVLVQQVFETQGQLEVGRDLEGGCRPQQLVSLKPHPLRGEGGEAEVLLPADQMGGGVQPPRAALVGGGQVAGVLGPANLAAVVGLLGVHIAPAGGELNTTDLGGGG